MDLGLDEEVYKKFEDLLPDDPDFQKGPNRHVDVVREAGCGFMQEGRLEEEGRNKGRDEGSEGGKEKKGDGEGHGEEESQILAGRKRSEKESVCVSLRVCVCV